ncbi:MAG: hypothetical protein ABIO39_07250 [Caulobacteraceae bacterium]
MSQAIFAPLRRGLALAALAAAFTGPPQAATAASDGFAMTTACDDACLQGFADRYLAAMVVKSPSRLPWAARVRASENNVMLRPGDGLWGAITGGFSNPIKFTDPQTGNVGVFALVEQRGRPTYFGLRLKVTDGKIAEVETLVNQPDAEAPPSPGGGDPKTYFHYPEMSKILPEAQRTPRLRMIDLANGYFSTLQLNDGRLLTEFSADCRRQENGFESAGNPKFERPEGKLSCGEQFKTGTFIFDDAVRDRDYMLVDEARGLVLARGTIDHSAARTEARVADGHLVQTFIKKPGSVAMLELFHITAGKIDRIEVVHIATPYAMPSVWRRDRD